MNLNTSESSDDLYVNLRGIGNVGKTLTRLAQGYRDLMDPAVSSPPAYIRDLMGDYTIPSMFLRVGHIQPATNAVNLEKRPFNVARVVQALHSDLMGSLRNIKLTSQEPQKHMTRLLNKKEVQDALKANAESVADDMRMRKVNSKALPEVNRIINQATYDLCGSCAQVLLPTLSFTLTHAKTGQTYDVSVPNHMVTFKPTEHRPADIPGGIPLAVIAWGLGEASTGKIMAHDASLFIQNLAGTQEGLTTSMGALQYVVRKHLPDGTSMSDFLSVNGHRLNEIIREEAHSMQILRAMAFTRISTEDLHSIDALLLAAGVNPIGASLATATCARDTACMLYTLSDALTTMHKDLEENTDLRIALQEFDTPKPGAMRVADLGRALLLLADSVSKCGSQEAVSTLLRQRENKGLLEDISHRIETLQQKEPVERDGYKANEGLGYSLALIKRDLVPELAVPVIEPRMPVLAEALALYKKSGQYRS